MTKLVTIFIGICIVGFIGAFIYFVGGVSSTYAPIKTYDYTGNLDTLVKRLHLLAQDKKSMSFTITDTTGTDKTGYNYYFKLNWITSNPTDTIEYSIVLSKTDHWFTANKTVIQLVEAIDLTHLSGGYSQTAKGIQPLVKRFDIYIIPALIHNKY
jgi:hypothetical protein